MEITENLLTVMTFEMPKSASFMFCCCPSSRTFAPEIIEIIMMSNGKKTKWSPIRPVINTSD